LPDFLTQIIRRSTAAADVVRPRLPSRFEPLLGLFGDEGLTTRLDDNFLSAASEAKGEGKASRIGTAPRNRDSDIMSRDRAAPLGRSAADTASAQPRLPAEPYRSSPDRQSEGLSLRTETQGGDDTQAPAGPNPASISGTELSAGPPTVQPFNDPTKRPETGLGDATDDVSIASSAGLDPKRQGQVPESPIIAQKQERAAPETVGTASPVAAKPEQQASSAPPPPSDAGWPKPAGLRQVVPVYVARAANGQTAALSDTAARPILDASGELGQGGAEHRRETGMPRVQAGMADAERQPSRRADRRAATSAHAAPAPGAAGPRTLLATEFDEPSPFRQYKGQRDSRDETSHQSIQDGAMPASGQAHRTDAGRRDQVQRPARNLPAVTPFVPLPPARGRDRVRTEETTVQVTIGRIEVRAVTPPPAPVKPKGVPKVMTLDEYLHRKDEGRP
jgi:hypothetical protein